MYNYNGGHIIMWMATLAYRRSVKEILRNDETYPGYTIPQAKIHKDGADLWSDPSHPILWGLQFLGAGCIHAINNIADRIPVLYDSPGRISTVQDTADRIRVSRFLGTSNPRGGADLHYAWLRWPDPRFTFPQSYEFSGRGGSLL